MDTGRLSALDLVLMSLELVARYDRAGPALNSVLEVNPEAAHIAAGLDAERARQGPRTPLHGIPVLLKDNISTADCLHTSAGSLALAGVYGPADAFIAGRLRRAGAVILGKANMTEWANFMADGMPSGYSSRGGQVLNPYGPGRLGVGGSSSGSGAAVAAGLVPLAVGTETSGSILSPAQSNAVVGIKPTVGLVSRHGIIPIMTSQDTAGPLARTVTDAALLLEVLAGVDANDPATWGSVGRVPASYTQSLDGTTLRGRRLGVTRDLCHKLSPAARASFESALDSLRQGGAEVVDPVGLPTALELTDLTAMTYEFKPALNAYLGRLGPEAPVHSLAELITYNQRDPERMLKYGQARLLAAEATSGTLTEPAYIESRLRDLRLSRTEGIDRALAAHRLDALVFPGTAGAAIAARAGYPSVTVPAGYGLEGQPYGVTFSAGAYSEPLLVEVAFAFEQLTGHRRPPVL